MFDKSFKPTEWAINNKVTIFVLTIILVLIGALAYNDLPKEQFPEIVIPNVYVQTIYQGTSPEDIESLITVPIEKELKSVTGVKKITSQSYMPTMRREIHWRREEFLMLLIWLGQKSRMT